MVKHDWKSHPSSLGFSYYVSRNIKEIFGFHEFSVLISSVKKFTGSLKSFTASSDFSSAVSPPPGLYNGQALQVATLLHHCPLNHFDTSQPMGNKIKNMVSCSFKSTELVK